MLNRRHVTLAATAAAFVATTGRSEAQGAATLRIVVGFPPGGAIDVVARQLGEAFRSEGVVPVVDNRSGAAGKLAIDAVKAAAPDGNTIMVMPSAIMTMETALFRPPRFDTFTDFTPVSAVSQNSQAIAVGPATPATRLQDFLAWCQANPDKATFASPGAGTPFQFLGQALSQRSGVALLHVPFRGGAQALPAVMGSQVTAIVSTTPNLVTFHRSGQLRILAISNDRPLASLPGVPTFAQAGYPGIGEIEQFGVFLPGKASPAMAVRMAERVATAVRNPSLREAFAKLEFESVSNTPDAYVASLRSEARRWEILLRQLGHQPQSA